MLVYLNRITFGSGFEQPGSTVMADITEGKMYFSRAEWSRMEIVSELFPAPVYTTTIHLPTSGANIGK